NVERRDVGMRCRPSDAEPARRLVADVVVARIDAATGDGQRHGSGREQRGGRPRAGTVGAAHVAPSKVTLPSRATRHARMPLKWYSVPGPRAVRSAAVVGWT